ncbi:MFS transporter [Hartmannibacter diazotrophicus]|nr:MFS transporter [Hartmannibacter diazotrophicus]
MEAGLVILALAVGSFAIGTGEFAIMGLLPTLAEGMGVTTAEAGHAISAYALGVVVGAPLIAVLSAKLPRKTLLLGLMAIFAVGNVASAFAPDFTSFTVLRFFSGLPHGAYFGVAALVAASMVTVDRRARAVGMVMLGLSVATLVGTPVATWAGQTFEWRILFDAVGILGALTACLIWLLLPKDDVPHDASPLRELGALKNSQVLLTLMIGAVGFGGLFAVFSYIAPTATGVAGLSESAVPMLMALFGAGMILGNTIGSRFADKALMATIFGVLVWSGAVGLLFYLTAANAVMISLMSFLVGGSVALGPALQTRLMDVAADAQTLAAALNHSAFNIANALGAWLGGMAIASGQGFASTGLVGAFLACAGILVFGVTLFDARRRAFAA